jgi:acyl-CoA dehydrogenase
MNLEFDKMRLPNSFYIDEHKGWQSQRMRFFDNQVLPYAPYSGERGDITHERWTKPAAMGVFGPGYSQELGGTGEGINIWYKNILNEELAHVGAGGARELH